MKINLFPLSSSHQTYIKEIPLGKETAFFLYENKMSSQTESFQYIISVFFREKKWEIKEVEIYRLESKELLGPFRGIFLTLSLTISDILKASREELKFSSGQGATKNRT